MKEILNKNDKLSARWIYTVCALTLLVSNGVLAWKVFDLRSVVRASVRGANPAAVIRLLDTTLTGDDGTTRILAAEKADRVVLFVFTPDDCGSCLTELTELNAAEKQGLHVFALMSYGNLDEARQTRRNFQVVYPILLDDDARILDSLNPPKTPWKILVDLNRRRILYEDFPSVTEAERAAFLTRLSVIH